MKNRKFERNRRLAKQYHRNQHHNQFEQGILVYHDYSERDPDELSWWDDVAFILGKVRVVVTWQHPRCVYWDKIEDAAMKAANHLYPHTEGDNFFQTEKNYKKVGRSRKKVHSHVLLPNEDWRKWGDAVEAEKIRLRKEADFIITPSMKVEMLERYRHVAIVAPLEIRNVEELRQLADLVRRILKKETTLETEFPDYTYGKAQWYAEGWSKQSQYKLSQ
ncbi:hypothetical protein [Xenorhabdus doucetiae]|uniref:Uncharacterized protein n=1 Tax=Xenorhabdus doucetiae TaxID=351671 RepID=A0A068QVE6_9GAMM|nr:hypothetical protein [Xenorhabdus doucetiae]TYP10809.1 hypothetical protein LY16_01193 [Xenorhabdus doucetiae]CDG17820.1 conserved protein of unknown function [Xenorhabdus doucetiae]